MGLEYPKQIVTTQFKDPELARQVLELIAPIARQGLLASYDVATKVTPYAASMLGRKKRSGEKIVSLSPPVPPFGLDTGRFRASLERLYTLDRDTLSIYSDLDYAERLLSRFEEKGYPVQIEEATIEAMEKAIIAKLETAWAEKSR